MAGMSTANKRETFVESAAFAGDGFRLDEEAGIAYGVAICGGVSKNGRDYPAEVRDRDKGIYEGVDVYLNHKEGERDVMREWFGQIRNPRTRLSDKKTIGDHHFPKDHQHTAAYLERVKRFPRSFGFSHVAECSTKRVNGRESITAMKRAESVDLVARPATNVGIYESQENPAMEQELAEAKAKLTAALADAATLKEQVTALTAEKTALVTENTALKAEAKQLKEAAEVAAVASLFTEAGVVPTDVQRKAVSAMTDPADRKALVESFKLALQGEKPKSQERQDGAAKKESVVPKDGKAFAEFIK